MRNIGVINEKDIQTNNCKFPAEDYNNYFVLPELLNAPSISYKTVNNIQNGFSFHNITEFDVWNAISRIK